MDLELKKFTAPSDLSDCPSVILSCDCLDTFAEISLNGQTAGRADNMFLRTRLEVKQLLVPGENVLSIRFFPADLIAKQRADEYPYPVPYSQGNNKIPHMNHTRKVACHAGWDWGICLLVCGIYGDVVLEGTDLVRIEYLTTRQVHEAGVCAVTVNIEAASVKDGEADLRIELCQTVHTERVPLKKGTNILSTRLSIEDPRLWWPRGYGPSPLHLLKVTLGGKEAVKRIGLRKLEILHKPGPGDNGAPLVFRINDTEIFCKGANFIPIDAMPGRMTAEGYRDLLESAVSANMNILRVWGGGQYERDEFYALCDELGIMVWQDFMFSCSLYPANGEFLSSVEREAAHQVRRLMDHACIVLWCGNNEVLQALNWYEESRNFRERYRADYFKLNDVLAKTVRALDPDRGFWPASPSKGPDQENPEDLDPAFGDTHYWDVWFKRVPFDTYYTLKPRFVSEFGFQSFPSLQCIAGYAEVGERDLLSPVMKFHQRHPEGNEKILEMFDRYFRRPAGLPGFVWLSQVQQALAIRTAVEYFRSLRPYCMGTIYWQLNDLWPVCSWSSIEYGGKWKLLHYFARRFYADIILTSRKVGDTMELYLVSDRIEPSLCNVSIQVISFDGQVVHREDHSLTAGSPGVNNFSRIEVENTGRDPDDHFYLLTLNDGKAVTENTYFFREYKHARMKKAAISASIDRNGTDVVILLKTDYPAFFVTLDLEGIKGEFSDNGFTLLPWQPLRIIFNAKQPLNGIDLSEKLTVRDLSGNHEA